MRVHHLALRTRDLERLVTFYSDVLGLPVTQRSARGAWLDADGTIVMLEHADAFEPEIPTGTMEIVVFAVPPAARARFVAKLAEAGVALEGETAFTVYFRDPDGRRLGLSHYPEPRVAP